MRRLVVVSVNLPHGHGEPFLLPEIAALAREVEVVLVPMRPRGGVFHREAAAFVESSWVAPLLSPGVAILGLLAGLRRWRRTCRVVSTLIRESRTPSILLKNLAVLPKGLWLASLAEPLKPDHIHSYWAATSATMAMIAAELLEVPWSFTAHRWDITEDNLLAEKVRSACFVRAISRNGAREIADRAGGDGKVTVLHLGVDTEGVPEAAPTGSAALRVLMVGNFSEVKGHEYLIAALARLDRDGVPFACGLAGGDGPLRKVVARQAREAGIAGKVRFLGMLPHPDLLRELESGEWDAVVLTSVVTPSGEKEGIPVSLMEAMIRGVPVVATDTGGIPELLEGGAGILVPQRDPEALAAALARLHADPELRRHLGAEGRRRIEAEFGQPAAAHALLRRMRECR